MEHDTPFQLFSPIHLAYLYRMDEKGLQIVPSDLDSIEAACPDAARDPLFADYRARFQAGTIRRRPGRKPITIPTRLRYWAMRFAFEDETAAIWAKRRSGEAPRVRGDREPCYQAAEIVIERFGLYCTPETLLNRLSRLGMS